MWYQLESEAGANLKAQAAGRVEGCRGCGPTGL